MLWRKFNGDPIQLPIKTAVEEAISKEINEGCHLKVCIGTDSQVKGKDTEFAIANVRRFAEAQGYSVDWSAVSQLDDYSLVNAIAQIAPFDYAAKQALLEARGLSDRADTIVQLMQFFGRHDGSDDRVTLQ